MTGDKYNVPSPAALAFELPESRANYPAAPVALHRISKLFAGGYPDAHDTVTVPKRICDKHRVSG